MEQDQRLTPLSRAVEVQSNQGDYPHSYSSSFDDDWSTNRRSLRQYANVIYKRLPIIIAIAAIVTVVVSFYSFRQPSIFSATTVMLIEPRKPQLTSKDTINIDFGDNRNYYNTQLRLLQNPDLMRKVVIALGLQRDANLMGTESRGIRATISSLFSGGQKAIDSENALPVLTETSADQAVNGKVQLSPEENSRVERYASTLVGGLRVEQSENTNIFSITITNPNAALAARVTDKIGEVFISDDATRELEGSRSAYDELSKSIDTIKGAIDGQEDELTNYMRSHSLPLGEKGTDLSAIRLTTISAQWLASVDERRKIEASYNGAVAANAKGQGMNIPQLYENKIFQDTMRLNTERKAKLQDQIRDIENQIKATESVKAEKLVKYTKDYVDVKQLDQRIASLTAAKAQTELEVGKIIDRDQKKIESDAVNGALVSIKSQLDASVRREAQLLNQYEKEAAEANVQGQAQTTLITLKRELETNRGLLDTYTQRQKEMELAIAAGRPTNIKISTHSITPETPIGPNRSRNILVALLVSLAAGIGLAFLLDYLDDSVRSSDDVGRHLGLPTLALIPHHNTTDKRKASLVKVGTGVGSAAMITLDDRQSPMAEAYRHLRTSLLFSSAGRPPQTILITSSQPSEGKTTTAINTAITLAQADADVVIVDCDLRRPRLHSHFGLENTQGLTNYLSGEKSTENLIKSSPDLPRLKVVTSGPIPPNPAELLSSNEMRNLLQFLRGRFKHVIIDSPPAISFTDAAILSTQVDGVVLVAMAGKSSIHLMRQFRQRLAGIGARIYGVVLNGIKSSSMEYDYYGSGYYKYYSRADDDESTPLMEEQQAVHVTKN